MARIVISEPVAETRELITRLVSRLGHEVVEPTEENLDQVDALVFEPWSPDGLDLANQLRRRRPSAALLAISALPPSSAVRDLHPSATITQPFSPADLERALDEALPDGNHGP